MAAAEAVLDGAISEERAPKAAPPTSALIRVFLCHFALLIVLRSTQQPYVFIDRLMLTNIAFEQGSSPE